MAEQGVAQRKGREGGRWLNERPTPEEFAKWFSESMSIDPELKHEDYIGGIVLIPAVTARVPYVTGFSQSGVPIIEDREELSYTPYAKVETRINYFWDLLDIHEEWTGVVIPEQLERMPLDQITTVEKRDASDGGWTRREHIRPGALATMVYQLPSGFSIMSVPVGEGYSHFLCCTTRVSIYSTAKLDAALEASGGDLDKALRRVVPRRTGRGTKQVPLLLGRNTPYADSSSLMKCETGALGRALGFAGIFVIPGSGIASAEDVQEAMTQGTAPAEAAPGNAGPDAPAEPAAPRTGAEQTQDDESALRRRAGELYRLLSEERPEKATEFGEWAQSRKLARLGDAKGAMLRGVVKKLERLSETTDSPEGAAEEPAVPASSGSEGAGMAQPTTEEFDVNAGEAPEAGNSEERSEEGTGGEPSRSAD